MLLKFYSGILCFSLNFFIFRFKRNKSLAVVSFGGFEKIFNCYKKANDGMVNETFGRSGGK